MPRAAAFSGAEREVTSRGRTFHYVDMELLAAIKPENVEAGPEYNLIYAKRAGRLYDVEKLTMFNVLELYEIKIESFGNKKIFVNSIPGCQLTVAN